MSGSASFFASFGNAVHLLTIVNTLSFAYMAGRYMNDPADTFFDDQWKRDGFCVQNIDVPYWNSHDVCLYVDVALALMLGCFYLAFRKTPGMEQANKLIVTGIPGIIGHGIGHGAVGWAIRSGVMAGEDTYRTSYDILSEQPLPKALTSQIPLIIFWLTMLKASMGNLKNWQIVVAAAAVVVSQLFIPNIFGFTFTQTVLMLAFSVNQLCRDVKEKDFTYAMYPALVGLPLTMVGWMESTQCTNFVRDFLYGHLVYDAFIPLSMMIWYSWCYARAKGYKVQVKAKTA